MTDRSDNTLDINGLDLARIEREARALQARAMIDLVGALRRSTVSLFTRLFHRGAQTHTA